MRKYLYILIASVLLTGCKTKYVAVPEYHQVFVEKHDTLVHRDSIFEKDSVYIVQNGDTITIYKNKILYRDRWRERVVYRDSVRTDSIRVPYPVEKKLTYWQEMWMNVGKILAFFISVCFIGFLVRRWLLARSRC